MSAHGPGIAEGHQDESPIVLPDDLTQFRALLWVLYALQVILDVDPTFLLIYFDCHRPGDLQDLRGGNGDLELLINITRITHKYHFTNTMTWALDCIYSVIYASPTFWTDSSAFSSLLDVAMLCDHAELRQRLLDHWIPGVSTGVFPPILAIIAGEKHHLPQLQTAGYYAQVISSDVDAQIPAGLSRDQRARLISGLWSLVKEWERLKIPAFTCPRGDIGCSTHMHAHTCAPLWCGSWIQHWKSAQMSGCRAGDLLGRLSSLHAQLESNMLLRTRIASSCRASALSELRSFIEETKDGLSNHFRDLTLPAPNPSEN